MSTNTQKLIILGLASFHLLKELFQLTQVGKWIPFFATSPIQVLLSTYMCFASHFHRWHGKDFFPNSYAKTRN